VIPSKQLHHKTRFTSIFNVEDTVFLYSFFHVAEHEKLNAASITDLGENSIADYIHKISIKIESKMHIHTFWYVCAFLFVESDKLNYFLWVLILVSVLIPYSLLVNVL